MKIVLFYFRNGYTMSKNKIDKFITFLEDQIDEQGLSLEQLTKKAGVSRMGLHYWLHRERTMSLENYYKLLEALGFEESYTLKDKWIKKVGA